MGCGVDLEKRDSMELEHWDEGRYELSGQALSWVVALTSLTGAGEIGKTHGCHVLDSLR